MVLNSSFTKNLIYWLSPTADLEQSLRAIWDAASWAAVLILSQIKLNSQLSSCTSFLVDSYGDHEGTQSGLPSFTGLHEELELWYQQWPLVPIRLLRECRQIWVSLSWSWISCTGWNSEFYLSVEQVTCPLPVGKILGGGGDRWNILGISTHGLDIEWGLVGRYWGIPT